MMEEFDNIWDFCNCLVLNPMFSPIIEKTMQPNGKSGRDQEIWVGSLIKIKDRDTRDKGTREPKDQWTLKNGDQETRRSLKIKRPDNL